MQPHIKHSISKPFIFVEVTIKKRGVHIPNVKKRRGDTPPGVSFNTINRWCGNVKIIRDSLRDVEFVYFHTSKSALFPLNSWY